MQMKKAIAVSVLVLSLCLPGAKTYAQPQSSTRSETEQQQKKNREFSGKVEVFVTSWCPYCTKLQKFLKAKGIRYTAYDIETDTSARKRYNELGVRGVPVTRIGSLIIQGYNPDAVLKAIESEQ